ncbi:response regulator [Legionella longbeachae]|uniref:Putative response regulator, receiver domain n=1 Tax=Legionella longbeachae serogroup 1 (strain NSW150) TaxID=661367 RepID=D3HMF3_LEGLN|nr:response regulator [Legionella longbeachae]VEE04063.1 response regulator, receiver domain [Legionella oakridgensis]HBD7396922.1 response regulator [Legionella pneumophila]ARB93089.1 response regulator [Legionella longbeachae]ARM33850.1 response regulator [Legionella longbeachae]EEZ96971.1 response regulator receiver domain protein [Legionella longbeachae D-4968]
MTTQVDILYVEDDEVDIKAVEREFLKMDRPINVAVAKDGKRALDMLYGFNGQLKIKPNVILLDLNLPQMNGIDFLKKLREGFTFNDVKVFVLTGAYTTEEKLATSDLNISGCIIKPLKYEDALNILWCASAGEDMSKLLFMQ